VKRRVILPQPIPASTLMLSEQPKYLNVSLQRSKKKEDFGVVLGCKIYIKEIISRTVADKDGILKVRYSEKATKLKKISLCILTLLSNYKKRWDILSNFVAFSQYLNFKGG
jgi:hypothetical protein